MYGILNDGIKQSIVTFSPEKLDHLKDKYGHALRPITGNIPLQPAAVGTATVEPIWKQKAPEVKMPPVSAKAAEWRQKGKREKLLKPIINVTTGQYFPSVGDAAMAIGADRASVGQQANGKCKTIKGYHHRYATPEEIKAKRMLTSNPA